MKKQFITEAARLQKLAGIITKSEYKNLTENKALDLLNKGIILYVSDDSKLAPGFVEPKGIGFIVYNVAIKDTSKSINPKVVQIFNDNYGVIDINYITTFLTNPDNWKAITSEDELDNFMSKYNKIYLINHNDGSSQLKESINEAFNPFLDTEEGGYMREYIDDVVKDSMGKPKSLNLKYRSDFNIAFNLALTRLQNDHPELDFEAIKANKEVFY
jgi:hypothetical protein